MPNLRTDGPAVGDAAPPPRPLDQLRAAMRLRHDSMRTETAYVDWVRHYIRFHGLRHPRDLGAPEVEALLSELVVQRHVSSSTPSQARSALRFLCKETLHVDLPSLVAMLLYGTGMRLLEALRRRVKDIEVTRRVIVVREGKGAKDRVTVLPENLIAPLQAQPVQARALHQADRAAAR